MRTDRLGSWRMAVLALAVAGMATAMAAAGFGKTPTDDKGKRPEATGPHAAVIRLFPVGSEVTDWKASGDTKIYGQTADVANGVESIDAEGPEAALVRGYEFVKLGTRKYVRGATAAGETVTMRVFEMKTSAEAFGLYSLRAVGTQFPTVDKALEARMSDKSLGFIKNQFFVLLQYTGPNNATGALMEFGNAIANLIDKPGYLPTLVDRMPSDSLQGQRYFLHQAETLLAVPCVPKTDIAMMGQLLALKADTSVAIAVYAGEKPGENNSIFVIQYPTEADATAAYKAYDGHLQQSKNAADQNIAIAPPVRTYLAGTFNAEEDSVPGPDGVRKYDMLSNLLRRLGS
jgi:hypothetical protein